MPDTLSLVPKLQLSLGGRKYGARRDLHDYRDHSLPKGIKRPAVTLPRKVDLREWCGSIKDQGQEGSCTGHAGSSSVEWQWRKYKNLSTTFSPQFLYCEELLKEGTFPEDNGAMPRTICQILNGVGVCEESIDPYVAGQIREPTIAQIQNAAEYKLGGYHRLNGLPDVLSCLGNQTPWPVLVAFQVYDSFESDKVAQTGIMPVPNTGSEMLLGGHEVLAVGYDTQTRMLLIQNSWGNSWGQKGFFQMPFEVVADADLVSDLWIIHAGQPWK